MRESGRRTGAAAARAALSARAGATPPRPPREGVTRLRVRYCECDPMNVAHHAAYVPWLEIARTELLRAGGLSYAELEHAGVFLVVVSLEVKYRRPVRYDDVVEVRTTVKGGSKVKIEHEYEVAVVERSGEPGFAREMAAVAKSTLACVDAKGKIAMLPAWMIGEG